MKKKLNSPISPPKAPQFTYPTTIGSSKNRKQRKNIFFTKKNFFFEKKIQQIFGVMFEIFT